MQERDCMHQATQRASESSRAGGRVHAPGHTKGMHWAIEKACESIRAEDGVHALGHMEDIRMH